MTTTQTATGAAVASVAEARRLASEAQSLTDRARDLRKHAFRALGLPREFQLAWGDSDSAIAASIPIATEGYTAKITVQGADKFGRSTEHTLTAARFAVSVAITSELALRVLAKLPTAAALGFPEGVEQLSLTADMGVAYLLAPEQGPAFLAALTAALREKSIVL